MKKKLALIITTVAIATVTLVGATLAWFSGSAEVKNVITTGKIEIGVDEPNYPGNGDDTTTEVVPGTTVPKDPTVTNTGDNDAYVRGQIIVTTGDEAVDAILTEARPNWKSEIITINEGWTASNGYYYFDTILAPTLSSTLFEEVAFPSEWGNEFSEKSVKIDVTFQAMQADNLIDKTLTGAERIAALEKVFGEEAAFTK